MEKKIIKTAKKCSLGAFLNFRSLYRYHCLCISYKMLRSKFYLFFPSNYLSPFLSFLRIFYFKFDRKLLLFTSSIRVHKKSKIISEGFTKGTSPPFQIRREAPENFFLGILVPSILAKIAEGGVPLVKPSDP